MFTTVKVAPAIFILGNSSIYSHKARKLEYVKEFWFTKARKPFFTFFFVNMILFRFIWKVTVFIVKLQPLNSNLLLQL